MPDYPLRHKKSERTSGYLRDRKFAVGFLLGVLASIFSAILINQFSRDQASYVSDNVLVASSLLVAAGSFFVAARSMLEQKKLREAATDPVLIAHFGQREDARELVTFRVTNVGAGAAIDVHLSAEPPEDLDLESRQLMTNIFTRHHPFRIIPQGETVEFSLALGWNILGSNPLPPFKVDLQYQDLNGDQYESTFILDVREMEKLGAEKSPYMRMVSALEKIAQKKK
ncbi:hypothetical protein [Rhodosalinus sp.]|uniref:hypothetical protein n=1 Tax=Rhodosalinus sp. TaxID=2047741 RepID=UPI00397A583A